MLDVNDRTAQRESCLGSAVAPQQWSCLPLLVLLRHANDRSGNSFLVYRSAFQASSSGPGQSCPANKEFGVVVVGDHVDAGGLLDTPSTSSGAAAVS